MRGISVRSIDYIRSRATENMHSTCRIERVSNPQYDPLTGYALPGPKTIVYEGICRIWEVTGASVIPIGEEEYVAQTTNLSIPWATDPVPVRDDEVEITDSETDTHLIGMRFRIMDQAKGGDMRPTRRFTLQRGQEHQ